MLLGRKHWIRCLTLAAALAACADDSQPADDAGADAVVDQYTGDIAFPNKAGGNPLVPEYAALPFPSDFFLVKDTTTATGYRVAIPQAALPGNAITSKLFAADDGFSRIPSILAYLPGGFDKKSLPDPDDGALTVSSKSPAFLLKAVTWEKVPILIELDMTAPDDKSRALILRPLTLLDEKTQYVVLITNKLKTLGGKPRVVGAAFAALRDGVKTLDQEIEKQREDFKQVTGAIKALSLTATDVVLGWTFRTRSEKQVVSTLVSMQQAMNKAPLAKHTIVSDKIEKSGIKENRQVVASVKMPNFVGTDGKVKLDASGKAVQQGEREVKFGLTIPSTVTSARPIVMYGHGFLGGWIQGTRGTWNDIATKHKYVTAATNMGMHEDLEKMVMSAISVSPLKLQTVVSEVQQALVNVTYLARLVQGKLATEITGKDGGGNPVTLMDKDKTYYHGISNGGTFGFVVAATSPVVQRASIIVGGGGLTHFLQRAVQWSDYDKFLKMLYQDPVDLQLMMSLLQMTLDPIDSMNYSPYLITKRFTGLKPIPVAVHMAVNDSQVRNLVTEWVVRSAKIPLITPSPKKIYGLKTITAAAPGGAPAGTLGAMFVYDEKVTPSPKTNLPPKADNKTHGTVRKLGAYVTHVTTFLDSGKFIQVCKGACDPE